MGEGSVTLLPIIEGWKAPLFFHPKAAGYFDVFYIVAQGYWWMQIRKDMEVIFGAIDAIQVATLFPDNAKDVIV